MMYGKEKKMAMAKGGMTKKAAPMPKAKPAKKPKGK
jgi:hypothetical protein